MIAVKEAIEIALNQASPAGTEEINIRDASSHILAEDVFSDIDMPPFEKSSMDGFAFRAADCQNGATILNVVGTIRAGVYPEFKIKAGEAAKIMTGAPLPAGADSVQMVEKTETIGVNQVTILEPVELGKNVSVKGEIIKANSKVLCKGTFISPAVVGVLATVGLKKVQIYRRPEVAILITGDELVEVNEKPGEGQIRNSNGYALYNQVAATGALPELLGIAPDNVEVLSKRIELGLKKNVLLISGGVSMGEFDFVEDVLAKHGVKIYYDKVNIKPGKPTVFGATDKTLVFGLPGNPVSVSTVFDIIVKPALLKIMGFCNLYNLRIKAALEKDYSTRTKRENYHPAWTSLKEGTFYATPVSSKGSADVVAFAKSNSYLVTTSEKQNFKSGDTAEVLFRDEFWKNTSSYNLMN